MELESKTREIRASEQTNEQTDGEEKKYPVLFDWSNELSVEFFFVLTFACARAIDFVCPTPIFQFRFQFNGYVCVEESSVVCVLVPRSRFLVYISAPIPFGSVISLIVMLWPFITITLKVKHVKWLLVFHSLSHSLPLPLALFVRIQNFIYHVFIISRAILLALFCCSSSLLLLCCCCYIVDADAVVPFIAYFCDYLNELQHTQIESWNCSACCSTNWNG